ncbi:hypothetical protein [Vitiosangium sp. GDMCC 1.1324]|uniref:hypothetical protein n=1 Tax=Vitiosangium sp. (strain GDMCC 1.1324) TaxID=2138576 RepID=UPI000D339EE2|nr:hypothetical protein [Vitiosangium sp. GDMCC 1.1324]PTL79083.1 hypothetical protein DAT35_36350 [Vitiosangium sp. GDMCC 1.1324]
MGERILTPSPDAQGQAAFPFLFSVPTREVRRGERARRPHLRGRTSPGVDTRQRVLPFRRTAAGSLLTPELAEAMETALAEARGSAEGGRRQRAAEAQLLELLLPFLQAAVAHAWATHPRTHLEKEDLLQEARLRAQKLWRGFRPGWAGPGRTLYPAYAVKAVRQQLGNVLEEARLVGPTQWGRKLAARARRRVKREELSYEDALRKEGADHATTLGLTLTATRADEREAAALADESDAHREELALESAAVAALRRLPRLEREAVAVPLGLSRLQLSDAGLARHLGCTLAELHSARERGLATLRKGMARRSE